MSTLSPDGNPLPTEAQLQSLAIFPLGNVCLFPHTTLPLHIFEPRYRQMIERAIADDAPIAIATIDAATASLSRPSVHPVAGIGRIVQQDRLSDGRYNIVLKGVARVRVGRELAVETAWRQVQATLLHDLVLDSDVVAARMETLRGIMRSLAVTNRQVGSVFARLAALTDEPGAFADQVAEALMRDADMRLNLIAELRVDERLERLNARAGELLARFASMKKAEPRN